jgi:hypothetical protein
MSIVIVTVVTIVTVITTVEIVIAKAASYSYTIEVVGVAIAETHCSL